MILILGSTHDDILYFESVMTNKKEEKIFDRYTLIFGSIFNQEVVVTYDVHTSYISTFVTSYIIQKYFIVLIFVVGRCIAYSEDNKPGDIAISRKVLFGDVNQIQETNVKLGQIPQLPEYLESGEDVIGYLISAIEKRSFARYCTATFVSSNSIFDKKEKIEHLVMNDILLGQKNDIVFDCITGGAFLAANLYKIPIVAVKVIERRVNQPSSVDDYINVLKQYSNVGRAVVTCIGDIGRNDFMKE